MKKNFIRLTLVLFVISLFFMPIVQARVTWGSAGMSIEPPASGELDSGSTSMKTLSKIWNTVKLILQVAAVGAFIYAGVKYMFASADVKADLKKSMGMLVLGATIAFGATIVVDFIVAIVKDTTTPRTVWSGVEDFVDGLLGGG